LPRGEAGYRHLSYPFPDVDGANSGSGTEGGDSMPVRIYYFAKPLNMELLLADDTQTGSNRTGKLKSDIPRDSQVEAMELVHSGEGPGVYETASRDDRFPVSNPDLISTGFAGDGDERTRLYQKIKGISQQSISDFIRTIRLKKAVQIMTHEDVTLTEVMMRIGIQTQSYFTKAFKKEFGKTPTQFMQGDAALRKKLRSYTYAIFGFYYCLFEIKFQPSHLLPEIIILTPPLLYFNF